MNKSPYEILGVAVTATQDEIKNAYRNLAKKLHPDLNPGNKDAEKKFKEINSAYELLGTPESRAKFDRGETEEAEAQARAQAYAQGRGARQRSGPFYHETQNDGGRYSQAFGGSGIDEDILSSIFGQMGGGFGSGRASRDQPGQDVQYRMDVDFKDAILGAEREITLPSGKRLRVKIPAGVDSGSKLRFAGLGSPGTGDAPAGDAYVELNVHPSALFKRSGRNLEIEVPISLSEAVLGAQVKVPTIEGSVLLKIPPGVSSGSRLRLAGKGVPAGEGKRGDEYVTLKIMVPPHVDEEFKQAVESWNQRQTFDPRAGWSGSQGEPS